MVDPSFTGLLPPELLPSVQWISPGPSPSPFAVDGRSPQGMVSVGSLEEAVPFLKTAHQERWAVIPRGAGTMMGLGNPPRGADFLLDLTGWDRVLEYSPENLTVTAESGLPLHRLQETLRAKGQFLPLDPPEFSSATLGGIVACNASGPKRLAYGTARDMILGMKAVLANGSVLQCGGRCVKNVSGMDLDKLFIGSLGTLGIIAEMTFKVHPLPEVDRILVGCASNPKTALQVTQELLHSSLFPAALEVLDPHLGQVWVQEMGLSPPEGDWLLLIGWVGFSEDVDRLIREGQQALSRHGAREVAACDAEESRKGWEILGHIRHHLNIPPDRWILARIATPLTHMEGAIAECEEASRLANLGGMILRAGSGILYAHWGCGGEGSEAMAEALERIRGWAIGAGGSLTLESAPLWLKERMDVWGPPGKEISLMRGLKRHFDSAQILNPGRYWGGI